MLIVSDLSLSFGTQILFKDVNLKFAPGNCYGVIGANGSGKSTFLRILSGEIDHDNGTISKDPKERIAVLKQDRFAFDEYTVLNTVLTGHEKLYKLFSERDELYAKEDFSDEDGIRAGEIEAEISEMDGYNAEPEAASMLSKLGIDDSLHGKMMAEIDENLKVRVLLAQSLFGNPDILLLDEPTNHLDLNSIKWLEDFLYNFDNTVIVVSHDRHFLNKVSTHIVDIDFKKINMFVGNYDFWYHASQLKMKQMKNDKKKNEDKIQDLQDFIQRFSANAAKSKQATSRKKLIDKLTLDELPETTRKFPFIDFKPERGAGKVILTVENLVKRIDGVDVLHSLSININPGEKIALVGDDNIAKSIFLDILGEVVEPDGGSIKWGQTISKGYFPKDNTDFFTGGLNIFEWLQQYSDNTDQSFVRGFLGRMLFSGEDVFKQIEVLSGGEKVRCMLSRLMLSESNFIMLDEPTSHLDLESITSLNDGLISTEAIVVFTSHDHQFVNSIANRILEFTPGGIIDRMMTFDQYMEDKNVMDFRDKLYKSHHDLAL